MKAKIRRIADQGTLEHPVGVKACPFNEKLSNGAICEGRSDW